MKLKEQPTAREQLSFRDELRRILAERELSQVDLQKLTAKRFPPRGVSISAIRQIATGKKNGTACAWRIALSLGLPPDYFDPPNGKRVKKGSQE